MMQEMMISVFGVYTPLADGSTDWAYVGSVAIFCICLWSLFKIVGMVFKK